jgi:hypothetical protein
MERLGTLAVLVVQAPMEELQLLFYLLLAVAMPEIIKVVAAVVHTIPQGVNSLPVLAVVAAARIFPKHILHLNLPQVQRLF